MQKRANLKRTSDSVIANNVIFDTGAPDERTGSAVRLFRGATGVTVQDNEIAVVISTQGLVPGDSEGNLLHDNRVSDHSWAIHVTGSYHVFERNQITAAMQPIVDSGLGNQFFENGVQ